MAGVLRGGYKTKTPPDQAEGTGGEPQKMKNLPVFAVFGCALARRMVSPQ
jgi:hypothetical protein